MKKIHIYYASVSGNTYLVISHIQKYFEQQGYICEIFSVNEHHYVEPADMYIFACGTYGHGLLQGHMEKFCSIYNPNDYVSLSSCGVIGLGDSKYDKEYNIESARLLSQWIKKNGGKEIIPALKINKSPLPHLEGSVINWARKFISQKNYE